MLTRKQHELLMFIDRHLRETGFSPSFEEMKDMLQLRSKSGIHRLITALEERGFLQRRHHRARALEVIRLPNEVRPRLGALAAVPIEAIAGNASPGGVSPGGVRSAIVPSGIVPSGIVPSGIVPAGIAPPGSAPPGAAPSGIAPSGIAPSGIAPSGTASTGAPPAGFSPNVIHGDFSQRIPAVRAANDAAAIQLPMYGRIAAGLPIEALRDTTTQIEVPVAMLGSGEHYALEVAGDSMIEAGILDGDTVLIRKGETAENGQIVVALIDDNEVTLKRLRRRGNSIALEPCNARHETRIFPAERVKVQGRMVALLRRYPP